MLIATWNVNSIRSRAERLVKWLSKHEPDVLCLQELKVCDEEFPFELVRGAGYHAAVYGQKTYNGVAILTRRELQNVARSFDDESTDDQARFITGWIDGLQVVCLYVPNGAFVGSKKYVYKLEWLERLKRYVQQRSTAGAPLVVCGDINIAPRQQDVARPDQWSGSVLFNDDQSRIFEEFLALGLVDVVQQKHPAGGVYSWWDYRQLGFQRNNGLRIDHILATPELAQTCAAADVDREERKGEKPSDHAPVWARFAWPVSGN